MQQFERIAASIVDSPSCDQLTDIHPHYQQSTNQHNTIPSQSLFSNNAPLYNSADYADDDNEEENEEAHSYSRVSNRPKEANLQSQQDNSFQSPTGISPQQIPSSANIQSVSEINPFENKCVPQQFTHQEGISAFYNFKNHKLKMEPDQEESKLRQKEIQQSLLAQQTSASKTNTVQGISQSIQQMLLDDSSINTQSDIAKAGKQQEVNKVQVIQNTKRSRQNLLFRMTLKIVETLRLCNTRYNYQPIIMNPKRDLTHPSEGVLNNGYDNADNDYILRVADSIITPEGKEYEILDLLGKGTFGQVVKCECKLTKEMVAIKVIKNKKAFKNQGVVEIKILDVLNRIYDPTGDSPLVKMLDFFVFRDHLCIVFELLSASIYDLLKENQFQGLSLNFSRLITSQILEGLKVVKEAKLIHCDLKPENILFKKKENPNIKVIDFGSACFEGFAIFQYIQSRYYRSPEVLLGLPYDSGIDMWSLGCICAELFLGIPIFPGNSEYDQLARIIEILGPLPQQLIQRARYRDKFFVFLPQYCTFRFKTIDEFQMSTGIRLEPPKRYIQNFRSLDDLKTIFFMKKEKEQMQHSPNKPFHSVSVLETELNSMDSFIDFLKGVLRYDKDQRWTPSMAMEHPFITRESYTGHYEPRRDNDRASTHDTGGEDSMSERSASSKDSKDYKAGSCPSKILYPQSVASLPQYMQQQPTQHQPQGQFTKHQFRVPGNNQPQQEQSQQQHDYVLSGGQPNAKIQSYRPPILSIPDEFFKGFMFGRLDQLLSMTRDQLFQFIYEQKELEFRQQSQRLMMQQQQQFLMQQQQQQMLRQQQLMQQQQLHNPNSGGEGFGMIPPPFQQFIGHVPPGKGVPNNLQMMPFPPILQGAEYPDHNSMKNHQMQSSAHGVPIQQNMMMSGGMPRDQIFAVGPNSIHQMGGIPQPSMQQQFQNQFVGPSEQIIYNPPPYLQQKQQLHMANLQAGDPQTLLAIQQQRQRFQQQANGGCKAGSWQGPNVLQAQKYNQYYNQINNPGQLIGRQVNHNQQQYGMAPMMGMPIGFHQHSQIAMPPDQQQQQFFQQQFYPVPLGLQSNNSQKKPGKSKERSDSQNSGLGRGASPAPGDPLKLGSATKFEMSEAAKRQRFGLTKLNSALKSSDSVSSQVIEEEKEGCDKSQNVPFPETHFIATASYPDQALSFINQGMTKKPSVESLHAAMNLNDQHLYGGPMEQASPGTFNRQFFPPSSLGVPQPFLGGNLPPKYNQASLSSRQLYDYQQQQQKLMQQARVHQYPSPKLPPWGSFVTGYNSLGGTQPPNVINQTLNQYGVPEGTTASKVYQTQKGTSLINASSQSSLHHGPQADGMNVSSMHSGNNNHSGVGPGFLTKLEKQHQNSSIERQQQLFNNQKQFSRQGSSLYQFAPDANITSHRLRSGSDISSNDDQHQQPQQPVQQFLQPQIAQSYQPPQFIQQQSVFTMQQPTWNQPPQQYLPQQQMQQSIPKLDQPVHRLRAATTGLTMEQLLEQKRQAALASQNACGQRITNFYQNEEDKDDDTALLLQASFNQQQIPGQENENSIFSSFPVQENQSCSIFEPQTQLTQKSGNLSDNKVKNLTPVHENTLFSECPLNDKESKHVENPGMLQMKTNPSSQGRHRGQPHNSSSSEEGGEGEESIRERRQDDDQENQYYQSDNGEENSSNNSYSSGSGKRDKRRKKSFEEDYDDV